MTVIKNSFQEWLLCYAYKFIISILSLLAVGVLILIKWLNLGIFKRGIFKRT